MVMMKYLFVFILIINAGNAASMTLAEANANSGSLRKEKKYREDAILNQGMIKKHFSAKHSRIIKAIKDNESIENIDPELQRLYLLIYSDYSLILRAHKTPSEQLDKDQKKFNAFYKILDGLEVKTRQVNSINDKVNAHINSLRGSIYKSSGTASIQYISWQENSKLTNVTLGTNQELLITNKGICLGGSYGIENEKYDFYVDGCALFGSGTVSGRNEAIYSQASLPFYGAKIGPGFSLISSSTKARVGLKFPIMYSSQKIVDFEADGSSYEVKKKENFFISTALYSRWYFKKLYVDLELGKFLIQTEAYWALGLGTSF